MQSVLAIVVASAPPFIRSSIPAALERFFGRGLLDHTLELVRHEFEDAKVSIAGPLATKQAGVTFYETSTTDLLMVVRELADSNAPDRVMLAVNPLFPRLDGSTLRALVDSARAGHIAVAQPDSPETPETHYVPAVAVLLSVARGNSSSVTTVTTPSREFARIDCKNTLIELERQSYRDRALELLAAGLMIRDPATTRIDGQITFGTNVEIESGCTLHGPITLGDRVRIGECCIITNATIGDDTEVRPFSMLEGASIGERSFVGPYARVRPGTSVGPHTQIGNFVELKAARLGRSNRINHLSFIGDATFADGVTIGAGTITCNHDGVGSQPTTIGAGAYVGSGCVLVAPVNVGDGATIGAGSTITKDAPATRLTLARTRQVVVEGWAGPRGKTK